ncbi:hypothetical protein KXV95_005950 [Aspergillus fumigatus]|nr:hypothetical protein KXX24_004358 [Aspergillus fumigatus]KAH1827409.1 hypothetical protein KXX35_006934 [Aspergillus fumigatus]KAH3075111.1 hypothetical protein KXW78_004491 [Aspergillus fumigatus]KAH3222987.1 hypothetical protein KXV77_007052 [Aspergillus fumigatus]KAH3566831.1 hypothetical protein KXV84_006833 [Aspergillus fumigatus]
MPPVVHCVRHAQGVHNLSTANHVIHDPSLTDLGNEQCRILRDNFPFHDRIELITASPLRRTIYTAYQSFQPVLEKHKDMKIVLLPDVQETSDVPCDTGSDPEVLRKEMEEQEIPVDMSLVQEGWNSKTGRYAPTNEAIKNRARAARRWLKERPEKEIIVVTHGGFLHYFTEDWEDSSLYQGTGWGNTEYRSFVFSDETHKDDLEGHPLDGDNATMVETMESRHRRGKDGPMLDRERQRTLYKLGTQGWDDQGLQLSTAEREHATVPEGMATGGLTIIEVYQLDARLNIRFGFHLPEWTRPGQFPDTCHDQRGHRSHGSTLFANGNALKDLAVTQPDDEFYSEEVIRDPPGQEDRNLVENQDVYITYFILGHSLDSKILDQYIQVQISPSEPWSGSLEL